MKPKMMMMVGETKSPITSSEIAQTTVTAAAANLRSSRSLNRVVANAPTRKPRPDTIR